MRLLASAVLGLALLVPGSSRADEAERVLKIVNNTKSLLMELYTSPAEAQAWGADQLGSMRIAAGGNVTVNLRNDAGACVFDLMMVFSDGEKLVRRENVCSKGTLVVSEHKDEVPLQAI